MSAVWERSQHAGTELLMLLALADAAMSAIHGCTDAQRLLASIREGCAPSDALLDGFVQVLQLGDQDRTRGFMRELQKRLERGS